MNRTAYTRGISLGLKVLIVSLAAGYIYFRFDSGGDRSGGAWQDTGNYFHRVVKENPLVLAAVFLLMPLNWLLEAWKWKVIASEQVKLSLKEALKGVLAGVTIGTATPNRVGEFAGRIFITKEGDRMQLLLLSFIASFCQVAVTLLAGAAVLLFSPYSFDLELLQGKTLYISAAVVIFVLLPPVIRIIAQRNREKLRALAAFPLKKFFLALSLSALRYSVYTFQFLLLLMCVIRTEWQPALACIIVSYFLVTLIPTVSFTEILIRGSVAGSVFSAMQLSFYDAFYTAILIWTINVAIPALTGTLFVFRLKFFRQEEK